MQSSSRRTCKVPEYFSTRWAATCYISDRLGDIGSIPASEKMLDFLEENGFFEEIADPEWRVAFTMPPDRVWGALKDRLPEDL